MRLKIEFDLVEDAKKQKEDFNVNTKILEKFKSNKKNFVKKYIEDMKNSIKSEFTFEDYRWVENLKVEIVEEIEVEV